MRLLGTYCIKSSQGFRERGGEEMTWQRPVTKLINGPRRMAKCRTTRCGVAGIGSQEECVITTP